MDHLDNLRARLKAGMVIPACPLALTAARRFDERRQRALVRYYLAAGAGGLAVGVHTTQFAIHRPDVGLYQPLLALAGEEIDRQERPFVKVAGLIGDTHQALQEADLSAASGYDCGLLSLGGWQQAAEQELLEHCRRVASRLPLFGFYLQPAVGGRFLSYEFWRAFMEIEAVVAVKIAPFNRYQTLDVVRALYDSGRSRQISLYTGNDDAILQDLLTTYRFDQTGESISFAGGLLGHWAVWTRRAVEILEQCKAARQAGHIPAELLSLGAQITDCNAALFDAANHFRGSIAGIQQVLTRQGLLASRACLDPLEDLSSGQMTQIERVYAAYPHLNDDAFVAEHLDEFLR
jgi:dihydrodipicolinate synthase/N-acetylneuraminate lyase